MPLFIDILTKVTLPIITLIVLGFAMQGRLKLDVGTLNRVQVHVVMPAFLVHFLATGTQPLQALWPVMLVQLAMFVILVPFGWLVAIITRQRRGIAPLMGVGTAFANVGFFGIPVTQLAFGPDYLIYQSVLTAMMAVFVCTVGVAVLAPAGTGRLAKLKTAFETPVIPAVILGLALRGFEIELPPIAAQPLQFLGSIFTPLALYTLGAQIASSGALKLEIVPQTMMLVLKFLVAPALAWWLCHLLALPHDVTAVVVVASATPVGVLLAVFAAEYGREPEFISTAVVISTALSPLVITLWVVATRLQ